jgi:hypothetical protein
MTPPEPKPGFATTKPLVYRRIRVPAMRQNGTFGPERDQPGPKRDQSKEMER